MHSNFKGSDEDGARMDISRAFLAINNSMMAAFHPSTPIWVVIDKHTAFMGGSISRSVGIVGQGPGPLTKLTGHLLVEKYWGPRGRQNAPYLMKCWTSGRSYSVLLDLQWRIHGGTPREHGDAWTGICVWIESERWLKEFINFLKKKFGGALLVFFSNSTTDLPLYHNAYCCRI